MYYGMLETIMLVYKLQKHLHLRQFWAISWKKCFEFKSKHPFAHTDDCKLPLHTTFRFYWIVFQLNTDFLPNFAFFAVKLPSLAMYGSKVTVLAVANGKNTQLWRLKQKLLSRLKIFQHCHVNSFNSLVTFLCVFFFKMLCMLLICRIWRKRTFFNLSIFEVL